MTGLRYREMDNNFLWPKCDIDIDVDNVYFQLEYYLLLSETLLNMAGD